MDLEALVGMVEVGTTNLSVGIRGKAVDTMIIEAQSAVATREHPKAQLALIPTVDAYFDLEHNFFLYSAVRHFLRLELESAFLPFTMTRHVSARLFSYRLFTSHEYQY